MIKRSRYVIILSLVIFAVFYVANRNLSKTNVQIQKTTSVKSPSVNEEKIEINGVKVVGLSPGREKEEIKKLNITNKPTAEWEPALEKTIRAQGGSSLKEVKFNKVDSFVWAQDGLALFVESVIVTVKNDKNVETTFRVLVDAQSGKILRNWDQPVVDPLNPKERFKISIDPRYHSE